MRLLFSVALYSLLLVAAPAARSHAEKPRKPVAPAPADQYPQHQTLAHITIAIEAGTTKETRPNTRLDYYGNDLLPVRIIITNETDKPMTLDEARIHLIAADGTSIPAATMDDLQRRMFTLHSATGSKVPLPLPIPVPISHGKKNIDQKILDDDRDFSFATTIVEPHATVAGYLFYDVRDLPGATRDEPLAHTTIELRRLRFINPPAPIDSFEIPLGASKP